MNDLTAFLDLGWSVIKTGVADGTSPARYPTLSTVSADGWPEARTLAVRHADRTLMLVESHTDITSDKLRSLAQSPRIGYHFWDPATQIQIRLWTTVEVVTGDAVAPLWDRIPPNSRLSYGETPSPGTPIPTATAYVKEPDQTAFGVLRCTIQKMDVVDLNVPHRRAHFERSDQWAGTWLAP